MTASRPTNEPSHDMLTSAFSALEVLTTTALYKLSLIHI